MKNFRVQIRAYGYYADFKMMSYDNSDAFNNALVDKLGKNDIKWEKDGFISKSKIWITYEEVIDANTSQRPLQSKEESRDRMGDASAR
jgi:hypothetical protein